MPLVHVQNLGWKILQSTVCNDCWENLERLLSGFLAPLFNLVFNVFSVLLLCYLRHSPTLFRLLIFLFIKFRVFIVVLASVVWSVIYHSPGCRLSLPSLVFCSGPFSSTSFPAWSLYLEQQSLPLLFSVLLLFFMAHITIFTKLCVCLWYVYGLSPRLECKLQESRVLESLHCCLSCT